jgi:hypothetical protein|tara:strand:+ start:7714 stop:7872 length:159 start_codon:yes stop_codon:yes gene_type:complete
MGGYLGVHGQEQKVRSLVGEISAKQPFRFRFRFRFFLTLTTNTLRDAGTARV